MSRYGGIPIEDQDAPALRKSRFGGLPIDEVQPEPQIAAPIAPPPDPNALRRDAIDYAEQRAANGMDIPGVVPTDVPATTSWQIPQPVLDMRQKEAELAKPRLSDRSPLLGAMARNPFGLANAIMPERVKDLSESAVSAAMSTIPAAGRALGGIARFGLDVEKSVADKLGIPTQIGSFGIDTAKQFVDNFTQDSQQLQQELRPPVMDKPVSEGWNDAEWWASQTGAGVGQLGQQILVGMATGGTSLGYALPMAAQTFGQSYLDDKQDMQAKGYSEDESTGAAALSATGKSLITYITNKIQFDRLPGMKAAFARIMGTQVGSRLVANKAREITARFLAGGTSASLQEMVEGAGQDIIEMTRRVATGETLDPATEAKRFLSERATEGAAAFPAGAIGLSGDVTPRVGGRFAAAQQQTVEAPQATPVQPEPTAPPPVQEQPQPIQAPTESVQQAPEQPIVAELDEDQKEWRDEQARRVMASTDIDALRDMQIELGAMGDPDADAVTRLIKRRIVELRTAQLSQRRPPESRTESPAGREAPPTAAAQPQPTEATGRPEQVVPETPPQLQVQEPARGQEEVQEAPPVEALQQPQTLERPGEQQIADLANRVERGQLSRNRIQKEYGASIAASVRTELARRAKERQPSQSQIEAQRIEDSQRVHEFLASNTDDPTADASNADGARYADILGVEWIDKSRAEREAIIAADKEQDEKKRISEMSPRERVNYGQGAVRDRAIVQAEDIERAAKDAGWSVDTSSSMSSEAQYITVSRGKRTYKIRIAAHDGGGVGSRVGGFESPDFVVRIDQPQWVQKTLYKIDATLGTTLSYSKSFNDKPQSAQEVASQPATSEDRLTADEVRAAMLAEGVDARTAEQTIAALTETANAVGQGQVGEGNRQEYKGVDTGRAPEGSGDSNRVPGGREAAQEEVTPTVKESLTTTEKPKRYDIGKTLTKEQRSSVLKTIGDSYRELNAPKVYKKDNRDGDPVYGYVYNPEYLHVSDVTGQKIRYYVTLPNGKRAHPSELFPDINESKAAELARERRAKSIIEKAYAAANAGKINPKEASFVNSYAWSKSNAAWDKIDAIEAKIDAANQSEGTPAVEPTVPPVVGDQGPQAGAKPGNVDVAGKQGEDFYTREIDRLLSSYNRAQNVADEAYGTWEKAKAKALQAYGKKSETKLKQAAENAKREFDRLSSLATGERGVLLSAQLAFAKSKANDRDFLLLVEARDNRANWFDYDGINHYPKTNDGKDIVARLRVRMRDELAKTGTPEGDIDGVLEEAVQRALRLDPTSYVKDQGKLFSWAAQLTDWPRVFKKYADQFELIEMPDYEKNRARGKLYNDFKYAKPESEIKQYVEDISQDSAKIVANEKKSKEIIEKNNALAADELTDKLRPLSDVSSTIAQIWEGNVTNETSKFVSDGRFLFRKDGISGSDVKKMAARKSTRSPYPDKSISDVFKAIVSGADVDLTYVGQSGDRGYFVGNDNVYPVDPRKLAYATRIAKPDSFKHSKSSGGDAIVMYQGTKPIAVLMAMGKAEDQEINPARALARLSQSGFTEMQSGLGRPPTIAELRSAVTDALRVGKWTMDHTVQAAQWLYQTGGTAIKTVANALAKLREAFGPSIKSKLSAIWREFKNQLSRVEAGGGPRASTLVRRAKSIQAQNAGMSFKDAMARARGEIAGQPAQKQAQRTLAGLYQDIRKANPDMTKADALAEARRQLQTTPEGDAAQMEQAAQTQTPVPSPESVESARSDVAELDANQAITDAIVPPEATVPTAKAIKARYTLLQRLQTTRDALIDQRRQAVASVKLAAKDRAKAQQAIRDEVKRLATENLPLPIRGKLLPNVANATTASALVSSITKMSRELARYQARSAYKQIDKLAKKYGKPTELTDERRKDLRKIADTAYAVRRGILKGASVPDMEAATAELQDLHNQMKEIIRDHRLENVAFKIVEAQSVVNLQQKIIDHVGKGGAQSEQSTQRERDVRWYKRAWRTQYTPDSLAVMMGDAGRFIIQRLQRAKSKSFGVVRNAQKQAEQVVQSHGFKSIGEALAKVSGSLGDASQVMIDVPIPIGGKRKITLGQAMDIYAMDQETMALAARGDTFNFETQKTEKSFRLTPYQRQAVADAMNAYNPRLTGMVDSIKGILESQIRDPLFKELRWLKGFEPTKVTNYWPRRRNRSMVEPSKMADWKGAIQAHLENAGFTKAREGSSKTPILIGDFMQTFFNHVDRASRIITMARSIRAAERVFLAPQVKQALTRRYGASFVRHIEQIIADSADMQNREFVKPEKWMRALASNASRAVTQVNPRSWARQLGGVFKLYAVMPSRMVAKGLTGAGKIGLMKEIIDNSPYVWARYQFAPHTRHSLVTEASELFTSNQSTIDRQALKEASKALWRSARTGNIRGSTRAYRQVLDAIKFSNFFDSVPIRVAWTAYKSEVNRIHSDWSDSDKMKWVAQKTEDAIRKTQNTFDLLDSSLAVSFSRRNPFMAPLLAFTSDSNKSFNMLIQSKNKRQLAKVITAIALNNAWNGLVTGGSKYLLLAAGLGIAGAMGDDEKEEKIAEEAVAKGTSTMLRELLGTVYGADRLFDVIQSATKPYMRDSILATPATSAIDTTMDAFREARLIIDQMDDTPEEAERRRTTIEQRWFRLLKKAGIGVGMAIGAPTVPLQYMASDVIKSKAEGEKEPKEEREPGERGGRSRGRSGR